jgi:hypothetical protein
MISASMGTDFPIIPGFAPKMAFAPKEGSLHQKSRKKFYRK